MKKIYKYSTYFPFAIFVESTFCPCQRFLQSMLFLIGVFYFWMFCPSQRFLHSRFFPFNVFLLFDVLSQPTLFIFYVLLQSAFFTFDVLFHSAFFSFNVLSVDVFNHWHFLLRRFVGEALVLLLRGKEDFFSAWIVPFFQHKCMTTVFLRSRSLY